MRFYTIQIKILIKEPYSLYMYFLHYSLHTDEHLHPSNTRYHTGLQLLKMLVRVCRGLIQLATTHHAAAHSLLLPQEAQGENQIKVKLVA